MGNEKLYMFIECHFPREVDIKKRHFHNEESFWKSDQQMKANGAGHKFWQ